MRELRERLGVAGVTAYLIGVGLYLRARGRVRPNAALPLLLARATQLLLSRCVARRAGELRRIERFRGNAYVGRVPLTIPARSDAEGGSALVLLEDGRSLGPGHATETAVIEVGRGRYYHWYDRVVFSTSDNTDPRANGRRYTVELLQRESR
jgi:hypothetical protein